MLGRIRDFVLGRWVVTGLGAIALGLLVWYFGELVAVGGVAPLAEPFIRNATLVGIAAVWLVGNLVVSLLRRRRNAALVQAIQAPPPVPEPGAEEVATLRKRFAEALNLLKSRRFPGARGRRWLGELPWYVMIGPPGSGKTTALWQSGLRFPLGDDAELKGVGGTRNCDWFFTEDAVLIDTAGRYTTQDSNADIDRAAWLGFLDLLRKYRGAQAVNGVLVALGVDELARAGDAGLAAHARAVRARLDELALRLAARPPVYILVTKADLLAGFETFMADLDGAQREQVWGFTLPVEVSADPAKALERTGPELDMLLGTLAGRQLDRLAAERDLERRREVLDFPAQVQSLKPALLGFLRAAFEPSRYGQPQRLRGVYLSSGTQKGTPLDRVLQTMAQSFGLAPPPLAEPRGQRSYFVTRLLREVVFGEAGLVGRDAAAVGRARLVRAGAWTAAALALLVVTGLVARSYWVGRDTTLAAARGLLAARAEVEQVARTELGPEDRSLVAVLPALEALRAVPVPDGDGIAPPGLRVTGELATARDTGYRKGLMRLLLPRVTLRLEEQLRANVTDPDIVLQALQVYLMLTGGAEMQPATLEGWYGPVDGLGEPGLTPEAKVRLLEHLVALWPTMAASPERPAADGALLARARETLQQLPLAQRAYQALLATPAVAGLPPWRAGDAAGPGATAVLVRKSGRQLNDPISGIYTRPAFHEVVLPALDAVAANASVEGWILGVDDDPTRAAAQRDQLKADILKLYYDDYIQLWEQLLSDVTPRPLEGARQGADLLKTLAGPSSPLRALLVAVVEETRLTLPPRAEAAPTEGVAASDALVKQAASKLGGNAAKLANKLLAARAQAASEPPGQPVEARFQPLVVLVEGANGAPPALDEAMQALQSLQGELQQVVATPDPEAELKRRGGLDALAQPLARLAPGLPPPLGDWVGEVAARAAGMGVVAIRSEINAKWSADVLPFCRKALGGRFPFTAGSSIDTSLADFSRLFAPGGLIDRFIDQELGPFVDMASRPWRWQKPIGSPDGVLGPLEQARRIRDALFAGGGQPGAGFTLKATGLDAGAARVVLDLDGQQSSYSHGPTQPVRMAWPGPNATNVVRLTFFPVGGGPPVVVSEEGAWSWFRLLRQGRFSGTNLPDLYEVALPGGRHEARFELRAGSVENPFDARLLERFRCPERL